MKKTFIQILVGTAVVVLGLMALNKFAPNFTLFPDTNEVSEDLFNEKEEPRSLPQSSPELDEENPSTSIKKPTGFFEDDEEELTVKINNIPKGVVANKSYSLDKRLKVENNVFVEPIDIIKVERRSYTNDIFNEVCPTDIRNYHKDFAIYFDFLDDKLVESILFLSVEVNKIKYVFKAQKGHNKLVLPNNLKVGKYQITFGYFLKKDATNSKIPYYAKNCMITVK